MNVFISWSGDRSRRVAASIAEWLPRVLQATKPWTSESIEKGVRWAPTVAERLNASPVGIICVTPENRAAPWLLFETGAIARTPDARVWTYLLDLAKTEVKNPLAQFQASLANEDDTWDMVRSINAATADKKIEENVARYAFDASWPAFSENLKVIAAEEPEGGKVAKDAKRSVEEMVQELLEGQRRIERAERQRLEPPTVGPLIRMTRPAGPVTGAIPTPVQTAFRSVGPGVCRSCGGSGTVFNPATECTTVCPDCRAPTSGTVFGEANLSAD